MGILQRQKSWDYLESETWGEPRIMSFVTNLRAFPTGDNGLLRLLIANAPHHAALWDVIEEHGLNREVGVFLDGTEYYYFCVFGEYEDAYYLMPMDGKNERLPDNQRFLQTAFHLRLPW